MTSLKRRSVIASSLALGTAALLSDRGNAQNESYTPDDLKSTLTPLGGLRAGNADGSIPPWTGGYTTLPADYKPGDTIPDPFPDEKPLLSITASNYTQYASKLSAGAQALFARYPDYRMDVYPTHRTAVAPQYVYDYTYKNAQNAQISADGNSISNAYGGVPFPIPKSGAELIWNHLTAWKGRAWWSKGTSSSVTADGQLVLQAAATAYFQYPYYYENGDASFNGDFSEFVLLTYAPPYQAGNADLVIHPLNVATKDQRAWEYLPGERRVREAPQLEYDTPISATGGLMNWDEYQIFYGSLKDYDFKLVGKKEMYVPYNMNKAWNSSLKDQAGAHFFNPDLARWELHRVWVVEMTVKQGWRNVDARRLVYLDEDTWNALECDIYDASGSLWKYITVVPAVLPQVPCLFGAQYTVAYDLHARTYVNANSASTDALPYYHPVDSFPSSFFTPGQLAAKAGGF